LNRYNFGCMAASDSLFDSRGRFSESRYPMNRGSKGRCHGNQFWDCISCKWTLTEDNDMRLSCKITSYDV